MNIETQMKITDEVMAKIYSISPYAIVAGGAPRDWYFGNPANDIDVFLYRPDLVTSWAHEAILENVGLKVHQLGQNDTNHYLYSKNPKIAKVFECTYKRQRFQFVFMLEKTFTSVVKNFPLNICMAWYKNGEIHTTKDFERAVNHQAIVKVNPLYADGDAYITKIKNKFPGFGYFSSYEELAAALLDK